eukprot:NODE_1201_length_1528_cov_6.178499_g996_i0.p1 GENE.NODE_1201_length_1528_cov_6.178499_g996_i0~~NODE_1201_length_1528_cov_6.178499_g996_i0.p1  ORF type:complete len:488 (+),score=114.45 NODE_1201_length_1528_cov_6.178499_g996_i0:64-1464(+)
MLPKDARLDDDLMARIWHSGHSRIPVYDGQREKIVGLLLTKDLILVAPEEGMTVETAMNFYPQVLWKVDAEAKLMEILDKMKSGIGHLAIVTKAEADPSGGDPADCTLGVVTLEDLIEELISAEILDETDLITDNVSKATVKRQRQVGLNAFKQQKAFDSLVPAQARSIAQFLQRALPDIFHVYLNELTMLRVVRMSEVRTFLVERALDGSVIPSDKHIIYKAGEPADFFTLIISGRVLVTWGDEGFQSELGPWSWMGAKGLRKPNAAWIPDFDARVTMTTRVFIITQQVYLQFREEFKQLKREERERKSRALNYVVPSPPQHASALPSPPALIAPPPAASGSSSSSSSSSTAPPPPSASKTGVVPAGQLPSSNGPPVHTHHRVIGNQSRVEHPPGDTVAMTVTKATPPPIAALGSPLSSDAPTPNHFQAPAGVGRSNSFVPPPHLPLAGEESRFLPEDSSSDDAS